MKFFSQNTGDFRLSCDENPKSLSLLGLDQYRDMTDTETDRRTDGQNYHS